MGFRIKKPKPLKPTIEFERADPKDLAKFDRMERRWGKDQLAMQGLHVLNTQDVRVIQFLVTFYAAKKVKEKKLEAQKKQRTLAKLEAMKTKLEGNSGETQINTSEEGPEAGCPTGQESQIEGEAGKAED